MMRDSFSLMSGWNFIWRGPHLSRMTLSLLEEVSPGSILLDSGSSLQVMTIRTHHGTSTESRNFFSVRLVPLATSFLTRISNALRVFRSVVSGSSIRRTGQHVTSPLNLPPWISASLPSAEPRVNSSSRSAHANPSRRRRTQAVPRMLSALYRRGAYVERTRREGNDADEYYLDLASSAGEKIRQRLEELRAELTPEDSRLSRSALEACTEAAFPLAGLLDRRSLPVEWQHVRRQIWVTCRDLTTISAEEMGNLTGAFSSPQVR